MTCLGNAAQIDCVFILVADNKPDQIDIKSAAFGEVLDVQHGMAGARNIERRIVIRLRQRHGILRGELNEGGKLDTSGRAIPLSRIRRKNMASMTDATAGKGQSYRGLRGWLDVVDQFGELERVPGASWDAEMGAI